MIRALLVACCFCLSVPALAQGSEPTDEDKSQAKRLVGEAQDAFNKGDFDVCAKKFSTAFKLAPLPQIQFNLALCYERQERYRDAALEYEAAAIHKDMPAAMQGKAKESLAKMREMLGRVKIHGGAGNALVDGSIACKLPCSLYLEAGPHVVVYGEEDRKSFRVTRQKESVVALKEKEEKIPAHDTGFRATDAQDNSRKDLTVAAAASTGPSSGPGLLAWGGGALAATGTAGALVFGLKTRSLHDDFQAMPTQAIADDGDQMRNLTNLSIGVAVVGVTLVVYDLLSD